MTVEALAQTIDTWISQYIAIFCLISIFAWAGGAYIWSAHWRRTVRDCGIYLLTIGGLALILALRPEKSDIVVWPPLAWFSFSMLIMMELLWVAFLTENLLQALRILPERQAKRLSRPRHSQINSRPY